MYGGSGGVIPMLTAHTLTGVLFPGGSSANLVSLLTVPRISALPHQFALLRGYRAPTAFTFCPRIPGAPAPALSSLLSTVAGLWVSLEPRGCEGPTRASDLPIAV